MDMKAKTLLSAATFALTVGAGGTMAGDGFFDHLLTLKISQSGFAGVSGTTYVIDELGNWQVVPFLNDEANGPERRGVLSSDQVNALRAMLKDVEGLANVENNVDINPQSIEFEYGLFKSVVVMSPAKIEGTETSNKDNAEGDIRELARWLEKQFQE